MEVEVECRVGDCENGGGCGGGDDWNEVGVGFKVESGCAVGELEVELREEIVNLAVRRVTRDGLTGGVRKRSCFNVYTFILSKFLVRIGAFGERVNVCSFDGY